mmetsp:Transcript_28451/g.71638  ORF Transcript_28451/g.71638 Transcript_28451/m.71638 type:complete len:101 (-) Transcript_28451:1164-1466(-)
MRRARIADLEATCCASAPLRTGRAEEGAPRRCAEAAEHRAVANAEFFFFFFFFFFSGLGRDLRDPARASELPLASLPPEKERWLVLRRRLRGEAAAGIPG